MLDAGLVQIVANLRVLGMDIADVEVKNGMGTPKSLRETLSAFSNARGGVVILGLDEGRGFAAAGLPNPAKIAADLGSMCSSEMEPPLRPLIGIHQFEGAQVVIAEIPELDPAQRPCFYAGAGMTKGSFVRVSDGDRRLSAYEVQVTVEASSGSARAAVTESMMAGDAGEVIHSLADEPDVTGTTSGSHPAGRKVMITGARRSRWPPSRPGPDDPRSRQPVPRYFTSCSHCAIGARLSEARIAAAMHTAGALGVLQSTRAERSVLGAQTCNRQGGDRFRGQART
jgi:Schlafen, AlbA_2